MRLTLAPLAVLVFSGCGTSNNAAIECPVAAIDNKLEVQSISATDGRRLVTGGENAIKEIASEIRRRRPDVSRAAIVNYLVTAYCPQVNRRSELDAIAKRNALMSFANRAEKIVSIS